MTISPQTFLQFIDEVLKDLVSTYWESPGKDKKHFKINFVLTVFSELLEVIQTHLAV